MGSGENIKNHISRRKFGRYLGLTTGAVLLSGCVNNNTRVKQTFEFVERKNTTPLDLSQIPEPVFEEDESLVALYWKAWEYAWDHVVTQKDMPQSPYMDEAFWPDTIWIWDTCFMAFFCKYAPGLFPGIESLDNFYEIMYNDNPANIYIQHPDNPPLFAWAEWEYYKMTGDKARLINIVKEKKYLQKHYDFFENRAEGKAYPWCGEGCYPQIKKLAHGYLWEADISGMDNTPRGYRNFSNMLWLDALAQQGLSAKYIAKIAKEIGDYETYQKYMRYFNLKSEILNRYYWNESDGFYYDISIGTPYDHYKIKTPASYWPLLSGMSTKRQAESLRAHASDPDVFGGDIPWPSVARDNEFFEEKGNYWRGSVWLPTAYMAIKGLNNYGYFKEANESSYKLIKHMAKTYSDYSPHTIWECYNPTVAAPGTDKTNMERVRPNFCGWSALGPISLFIENVLGFYDIDALKSKVCWNMHRTGTHGIKNLKFGEIKTDIIFKQGAVNVKSNKSFTLEINGVAYFIKQGEQIFRI